MKISHCLVLALIFGSVACSGVKTRKEAAEDAKLKTIYSINNAPAGPIEEDDDSSDASPATAAADDKVLNDELAAMGIDPSNPDGRKSKATPEPESMSEPEVHGNLIPAADPEPARRIAPRKTVAKATAKKAAPKKKPVKKTKPKKKKPVDE